MSGRYGLMHNQADRWAFIVFDPTFNVDVVLQGPVLQTGKWTHLFGSFDGAVATFYVDGERVGHVDADHEARLLKKGSMVGLQREELARRESEKNEREQARTVIREQVVCTEEAI